MGKILLTGACGYIGSHTLVDLIKNGYEVISIDNNINSSASVLDDLQQLTGAVFKHYPVDLVDADSLRMVFTENPDITGVIHFAALKSVNESVERPLWYYQNNLTGLLNLLEEVKRNNINNFIFSSSCSVYGQADELPVTENTPLREAECPYAYTKQAGERILKDICLVEPDFNCVLLRYFNPAGAHTSNMIGESPINPANNLVPVITETAIGKRPSFTVFGNDYNTIDGSCIRDYIHVMDIASAHTLALKYVEQRKNLANCEVYNLGAGKGLSVLQVVKEFETLTGITLNYEIGPRREGDVEAVYADNALAKEKLNWSPQFDIKDILKTAWAWEQRRTRLNP